MDALSILLLTAQTAPVLRDLPLPLPLPAGVLAVILVLAFLAHILFVDLLLGGSLLTLWAELRGRREARYLGLARAVAATVTVNKSLAVVLGVAPLLAINTLYPIFFYPATILTGRLWISLVPILIAAFLLLYLHKYRWEQLSRRPALRLGVLGLAVALLLLVPLVFLTNVNLMLFPQRWGSVGGFWSAALLPNVLPRYLHFVCATLAVTGPVEEELDLKGVAVHVKGMEPAGYDPRKLKGMGLTFATTARGACHLRTTFYKAELAGISDPAQIEGKAALVTEWEDRLCIMDTMIYCRFYRDLCQFPFLTDVVNAIIGTDYTVDEVRAIGAKIITMTHDFNLGRGFGAEKERLPEWITSRPQADNEELTLSAEELEQMRSDYYAARGWELTPETVAGRA